ncbi:O-antigen ligase family protein [Acidaminococcus fermentans]|uniref:O-antigen ligase family protein n=1 Tax=Acidaminococcus fermentans TaxID=905 RepID=UPI00249097D2|nr:O-antigen ligase family protein [Acidaminococcus fermentans]
MLLGLRNKLFFCIVLFVIFSNIPFSLQLNFFGSFLAKDLSLYPILGGVIYSFYNLYKSRDIQIDRVQKAYFTYIIIYVFVLMISFFHGLAIYPFYEAILQGPADQIEKLPVVQHCLYSKGIYIETTILLKAWILIRLIKGFIMEVFWYFTVPYLIFSWYRKNVQIGFLIFIKAVFTATILVCIYNLIDIFYLSGSTFAENILCVLNPIIHDIKYNGTWWPPLLWKGQLRSLFAEPSYYGIYSAFAMPFLWYRLVQSPNSNSKIINIIVIFIFTFGLFLTKARTANALFVGELCLLIAFSLWQKQLLKRTAFIISFSFITFAIATFSLHFMPGSPQVNTNGSMGYKSESNTQMTAYVKDNLESLTNKDKRSNRARFSVFEASIAIGKNYPLLGVGKSLRHAYIPNYLSKEGKENTEVQYWIKNQKKKGIMKSGFPALGEYCTRFAETGILGLAIYLIPAFYLALVLLKRIKLTNEQSEREKYIFFFISLAGIMASGLGDNLNITCSYWILMGLGYALILSPYKKKNHERT